MSDGLEKRKGSPYYYARFQINKRPFLRSTGKTTEREARAERRHIISKVRAQLEKEAEALPGKQLTLDETFDKYWKREAPKLSDKWREEVWRYLKHILSIVDKGILVENLTDAEVDDYAHEHLIAGGGKYALNRSLSVWRRIHNLSRKRWKQRTHEIDWTEFFNAEEKVDRPLVMHQAQRLIEVSPQRLADAIEWSILTGCRKSETYNLTWDDVFLEEARVVVIAKGGREHTIWLTPDAIALLHRLPRRGRYVFDKTNHRNEWEIAVARARLGIFRWHDLRHTHATWLRQAGAPVEVVQRSLGHGDIETTMRYAHVADHELYDALKALPSLSDASTNVVSLKRAHK